MQTDGNVIAIGVILQQMIINCHDAVDFSIRWEIRERLRTRKTMTYHLVKVKSNSSHKRRETTRSITTPPGRDASPSQGYPQHFVSAFLDGRRYPFVHRDEER